MSDLRSEAARLMGQATTEAKAKAARQNGKLGGAHPISDEQKQRVREGQQKRWAAYRAVKVLDEASKDNGSNAQPETFEPVRREE